MCRPGCHQVTKIARGAIGVAKAVIGVDRANDATVQTRRDVCRECPHAKRNHARMNRPTKGLTNLSQCARCECFIVAKTLLAGEKCPEGKW